MIRKLLQRVIKFAALFFFCLAGWLVYKEIHALGLKEIINQISSTSLSILFLALFFVVCDYLTLSGYDFLALSYIGAKLKKWLVFKTSLVSFSITNTTGHAYMAGGSVRYLFYSKAGLSEFQVLKVIAFESLTFLMGMGIVLDICLITTHFMHFKTLVSYQRWLDIGAFIVSLVFVLYVAFIVVPHHSFKWGKIEIKSPTLNLTFKQMLIGGSDIFLSSLIFYTLLHTHLNANYFHVAVIFLLAQLLGISSQVPGGLGVFEATFLYLYQHTPEQKIPLLAALISFRVLYYFLPLVMSCFYLIIDWLCKKNNTSDAK